MTQGGGTISKKMFELISTRPGVTAAHTITKNNNRLRYGILKKYIKETKKAVCFYHKYPKDLKTFHLLTSTIFVKIGFVLATDKIVNICKCVYVCVCLGKREREREKSIEFETISQKCRDVEECV